MVEKEGSGSSKVNIVTFGLVIIMNPSDLSSDGDTLTVMRPAVSEELKSFGRRNTFGHIPGSQIRTDDRPGPTLAGLA